MLNLTTENWVSLNFPYSRNIDKKISRNLCLYKGGLVQSNCSANKRVVWIVFKQTGIYLYNMLLFTSVRNFQFWSFGLDKV